MIEIWADISGCAGGSSLKAFAFCHAFAQTARCARALSIPAAMRFSVESFIWKKNVFLRATIYFNMKRLTNLLLVLMLIPSFVISQNYNKTKSIKLNYPIQDFSRKTKSLEVIDLRAEEEIGKIVYRGNYYAFSFPTNNAKNDIENWYRKQNKKKGINDIVMLIERERG